MDWFLSVTSCLMLWLMGDKSKWGPVVGVCNQCLWVIYAVKIQEYGLLLGVFAYTGIHIRNFAKWWKVNENRLA